MNCRIVGWAKERSDVPTIRDVLVMVGTLSLCPPYDSRDGV